MSNITQGKIVNLFHSTVISVPLLNMTSAAPLSVVLSLLPQRKKGKRGRSVSHVLKGYEDY